MEVWDVGVLVGKKQEFLQDIFCFHSRFLRVSASTSHTLTFYVPVQALKVLEQIQMWATKIPSLLKNKPYERLQNA